jgi:hypothetical protein
MSSDDRDFKELQARLLKLENQNRRFKQLGVTALIVLVSVVVMAQVPSGKTVEANEFILRDGSGTVRARLSMDETRSGSEMVLLDEKGRPRIKLEGGGEHCMAGSCAFLTRKVNCVVYFQRGIWAAVFRCSIRKATQKPPCSLAMSGSTEG